MAAVPGSCHEEPVQPPCGHEGPCGSHAAAGKAEAAAKLIFMGVAEPRGDWLRSRRLLSWEVLVSPQRAKPRAPEGSVPCRRVAPQIGMET